MSNKHLVTNYWDLENNVFKSEPDDFILPPDEDDGGEQRQRDIDNKALQDIAKTLSKFARLRFAQHQAW